MEKTLPAIVDSNVVEQLPAKWHILSYPRSGNHLVRATIEFCAERPTNGCLGTRHDSAIADRAANQQAGLIQLANREPVGFKAHFVREILLRNQNNTDPLGLVFITRDPEAAIASQLARNLYRTRWWPNHRRLLRLAVQREIDHYLSLVHLFKAYDAGKKIHVQFESLISEDAGLETVQSLVNAMGLPSADLENRFGYIKQLARSSQNSLPPSRHAFRDAIKTRIREICDLSNLSDLF